MCRSKGVTPAIIFGDGAARQVYSTGFAASGGAGITAGKNTATALSAKGTEEEEAEEKRSAAAAMSGVGSTGSNVLLVLTWLMVIKGLFLPENIR